MNKKRIAKVSRPLRTIHVCIICMDVDKSPLVLKFGHLVCSCCLNEVFPNEINPSKCPLCEKSVYGYLLWVLILFIKTKNINRNLFSARREIYFLFDIVYNGCHIGLYCFTFNSILKIK